MSLLSEDREPFRLFPIEAPDDTDLFSFSGSVGPNGDNRREDVIRAQTLLARSGDFNGFDIPTGWPSSDLWHSIKKFQQRNGMDADGTLLPLPPGGVDPYGVGETVHALQGELGQQLAGRKAPTPQEVDAHYEAEARWQAAGGEASRPTSAQHGIVLSDVPDAAPPQPKPGQQVAQAGPGSRKTDLTAGPAIRPVPGHKKDIFALPANKEAWDRHQAALHKLLPDRPALRHMLGSLYAEEGGRIADPASGAVGGILPETLDDMRRRGKLPDLPAHLKPGDLTPEQQAYLQTAYFDDVLHTVGGAKALEGLPQSAADMLGDALYLDGRGDGTRFLQQAINDAAGGRSISVDGRMGPQTWEALRRIGENPQTRDIWLDEAARRRISGKPRSQGEIDRISRLRPAGKR